VSCLPWKPLATEKSLQTYALLLHKYAYALLLTRDGSHGSTYHFNLRDENQLRAQELIDALQTKWDEDQLEDDEGDPEDREDKKNEAEEEGGGEEEEMDEDDEEEDEEDEEEEGGVQSDGDDDGDGEDWDGEDWDGISDNGEDWDEISDDGDGDDQDDVECNDDEAYDSPLVHKFHEFIRPFLYPLPRSGAAAAVPSKWDHPIERFMAVYSLRPDGNFRQAKGVTQMFATFHYHIRGAILYEGLSKCDDGDPYQCVFPSLY
jgi:hypothetical protein